MHHVRGVCDISNSHMKKKEPSRPELLGKAAFKRRGNDVQGEMKTEKQITASIGDNENLR